MVAKWENLSSVLLLRLALGEEGGGREEVGAASAAAAVPDKLEPLLAAAWGVGGESM